MATGVRQGELLALKWEDIDLDSRTVMVCRAVSYIGGKSVFSPPKTDHGRRTVELSRATVALLRTHRAGQAVERLKLGSLWKGHDLVFPSSSGTPWIARAFYRSYRRVVEQSGIDDPTTADWHTLRHTAASQWIRHGADVYTVSRRLGHASASFTMNVYAHLLKGQQRQAAEALDHLLGS